MEKENMAINDFDRYSKVSMTTAYFPDGNNLKFVVKLKRKDKYGDYKYMQSESKYIGNDGFINYNLSLNVLNAGWQIGKLNDTKLNAYISIGDIMPTQILLKRIINDWFLTNRIFKETKDGFITQGRFEPTKIFVNDYSFIALYPIVVTYPDGNTDKGCRLIINKNDNYVDLNGRSFFTLCTYLLSDPGPYIMGLVNYVNTCKRGYNLYDMGKIQYEYDKSIEEGPAKNFFTK